MTEKTKGRNTVGGKVENTEKNSDLIFSEESN